MRSLKTIMASATMAFGLMAATAASAQLQSTPASGSYIEISNDRGGLLYERIAELQRLRQTGQSVRITGNICYSTCTMFLALPQTCVSPSTTFGFHGPSSYGRPLDPVVFEQASRIMADHYPQVLKDWYMKTGRHEITALYRFRGEDIIRMGVASC
jgi:hypothetical protein